MTKIIYNGSSDLSEEIGPKMRGAPLQTREDEEVGRDAEMDRAEVAAVRKAILAAWIEFGEVPFPLYDHEVEKLASAAIFAIRKNNRERLSTKQKQNGILPHE